MARNPSAETVRPEGMRRAWANPWRPCLNFPQSWPTPRRSGAVTGRSCARMFRSQAAARHRGAVAVRSRAATGQNCSATPRSRTTARQSCAAMPRSWAIARRNCVVGHSLGGQPRRVGFGPTGPLRRVSGNPLRRPVQTLTAPCPKMRPCAFCYWTSPSANCYA
jgi:hypothetical protein